MSDFSPPKPAIGDLVYWYNDSLSCSNPTMGFIADHPGTNTVTIMTVSPFAGLTFRPSVRHKDDPGLQENAEWRQWGAWEFAPVMEKLKKMDALMADMIQMREKLGAVARQNQK